MELFRSAIAAKREAAIDEKSLAGNVIIGFEEKADGASDVLGTAKARDGAAFDEAIVFPSADARFRHSRDGGSRRDDIHANAGPFLRENASRMDESSLRRGVVETRGKCGEGLHGGEKDDAPSRGFSHLLAEVAREEDGPGAIRVERTSQRFAANLVESSARRFTGKHGDTSKGSADASDSGEIRLASLRRSEITGDKNNIGLKLLADGFAQRFGAAAIGAITNNKTCAFARQERNRSGTEPARRASEDDGAALERAFGEFILKLTVTRSEIFVPVSGCHDVHLSACRS